MAARGEGLGWQNEGYQDRCRVYDLLGDLFALYLTPAIMDSRAIALFIPPAIISTFTVSVFSLYSQDIGTVSCLPMNSLYNVYTCNFN